jgi:hypothetical protein
MTQEISKYTKSQISSNHQNSKFVPEGIRDLGNCFGNLELGIWVLFGVWDLDIGI